MFKFNKKSLGITSLSLVAILAIGFLGYFLASNDNPTIINSSDVVVDEDYTPLFVGETAKKANEYTGGTYTADLGYRINSTDSTACVNLGEIDTDITEVVVPDIYSDGTTDYSVVAVDYNGFVNLTQLETFTFLDSSLITLIDQQAFANDVNLTTFNSTTTGNVTIPANLTEINDSTFLNCSSISALAFAGNNVTTIGDNAFNNCLNLSSSLIFKDAILEIGRSAFANCINLPSILIAGNTTTVGSYAFYDCSSAKMIAIPTSVTSLGTNALRLCTSATAYIGYSEKYPATWSTDSDDNSSTEGDWNYASTSYEIPVILDADNVMIDNGNNFIYTRIWNETNGIYRITIIKFINDDTTSLDINATYLVMGDDDHNNPLVDGDGNEYGVVTNILEATYDSSTDTAYDGAFSDTYSNLTSISFPNTLENIGQFAFVGCSNLSSVTFADKQESSTFTIGTEPGTYNMDTYGLTGLTGIEEYAFCVDYKDVNSGTNNTSGDTVPSVIDLVLPSTLEYVADGVFGQWINLRNLTITGAEDGTSSLQWIGKYAFFGAGRSASTRECTLYLPSSLDVSDDNDGYTIGDKAFYQARFIQNLIFQDGIGTSVVIGNSAFQQISSLETARLPDNTDSNNSIGTLGFAGDGDLDWVYIPDSFYEIGRSFANNVDEGIMYVEADSIPSGWSGSWTSTKDGNFLNTSSNDCNNHKIDENLTHCAYYLGVSNFDDIKSYPDSSTNYDNTRAYQYLVDGTTVTITNFNDNSGISSVDFPDSLMTANGATSMKIGEQAFYEAGPVSTVTFGSNSYLTEIGDYAFSSSTNLDTFDYLATNTTGFTNLTSVGQFAFYNTKLTSVYLGANVDTIGDRAFWRMNDVTNLTVDSSNSTFYSDPDHDIGALYEKSGSDYILRYITGEYTGDYTIVYNTVEIEPYAFSTIAFTVASGDLNSKVDIVIPSTVTTIDNYAFHMYVNTLSVSASINTISVDDPTNSELTQIGTAAFGYQSALTIVSLSENTSNTVKIYDEIFEDCTSLTDVVLPTIIKDSSNDFYLPAGMFENNTQLVTVQLPTNITKISDEAFKGCTSLTNVSFPSGASSITEIGVSAFEDCTSLTTLSYSNLTSLTLIDDSAFKGCTSFTTFNFPALTSLVTIGDYAFQNCTSLDNLSFSASLTTIGQYAFNGNSSLSDVTLSSGLVTIDAYAFSSLTSLTTVDTTSATNLERIEDYAFYYDYHLTTFNFSNLTSLTYIDDYAFYNCDDLTSIVFADIGSSGSTLTIDGSVFRNSGGITSVFISDKVKTIGNSSFMSCTGITSVDFSEATVLTKIDDYAFQENSSLTSLDLSDSDSLTSIDSHAFKNCTSLSTVVFADNVTTVSSYSFEGCISLSSFTNIDQITNFSDGCFGNWTGSTPVNTFTIDLTNNSVLTSISSRAFHSSGLEEIILGSSTPLSSISSNAFEYCYSFDSFNLNDISTLTTIGNYAFRNTGFTTIDLSSNTSIYSIGYYAFTQCYDLTTFIFPTASSNNYFTLDNNTFDMCTSLVTTSAGGSVFELPDYIKTIDDNAFGGCTALTSVVISNSVTTINQNIFYGCSDSLSIFYADTYSEYLSDITRNSTWLDTSASTSPKVYYYSSSTPSTNDWTVADEDGFNGYWYYSGSTVTLWVE